MKHGVVSSFSPVAKTPAISRMVKMRIAASCPEALEKQAF
jgi:hypothetical protein